MPATREQFIETWNKLGSPTLVSEALGVSVRKVQERRRRIEATEGITLECHGSLNCAYKVKDGKPVQVSGIKNGLRKHCVIPDVQAKPGVPLDHLEWAGRFIAEKRPDVIVCIGDFADMPSLSSYDKGKRSFEGRRYRHDIDAAKRAMDLLMAPILKEPGYQPRLILTLGNHEHRIVRATDNEPLLDGTIGLEDLAYDQWGWEVVPFLKPIVIDDISYCHYFYHPNTGKPYAGSNLETRLKTIGMSFTMGHQQGLSIAIRDLANGKRQRGLVCGSFYQHEEEYRGYQGNGHWHGIIMKHEVQDGNYDLLEVSLNYLRRRYS
jgi:hypothetical protein